MSMMNFIDLDPKTFVRLTGVPTDDRPSDWHVNKHVTVTRGPSPAARNHSLVLQRADASEEWLVIGIKPAGDPVMEARMAPGPDETPVSVDPGALTIEATAEERDGLPDD
jgi:hypothetical protein